MSRIKSLLGRSLKSPAVIYIISRYATYAMRFVISLFLAVNLGPFYLGIWGFITMIKQYIGQINFGISHSANIIASVHKNDEEYTKKILGNAFSMLIVLSGLGVLLLINSKSIGIDADNRYFFSTYMPYVCVIVALGYFNNLLTSISRLYNRVIDIAIVTSIDTVILLCIVPFLSERNLLNALVAVDLLVSVMTFLWFIVRIPIKIKLQIEWETVKLIQKKGIYLFAYLTSFSFIMLSTRYFISNNYLVEEFGFFSFSYTLASAVLMLLTSIEFLIAPKMINRLAGPNNNGQISKLLSNIRASYISLSHFLVHLIIMLFPIFLYFFPDYQSINTVFKITALAIVLQTNTFGYSGVLAARGKEKILAVIAFSTLLFNVLMLFCLVHLLKVPFYFAIVATIFAYLLYVLLIGIYGIKEIGKHVTLQTILHDVYSVKIFLPYIISLLCVFLSLPNTWFFIPFVIYIIMNFKDFRIIIETIKKVISNKNFLNI